MRIIISDIGFDDSFSDSEKHRVIGMEVKDLEFNDFITEHGFLSFECVSVVDGIGQNFCNAQLTLLDDDGYPL